MKVLVTGANGFVGSHVLDCLLAQNISTAILLRETSNRRFIASQISRVDVRLGSINDADSVARALDGVTHVIHCAGLTRACRPGEFFTGNHIGTRNVVEAVNRQGGRIERLVHISSLAAIGPATPEQPAREDDPPHPVSEYGESKLVAEREVTGHCRSDFVVLRPPAVFGPRDDGFLQLFQTVKRRIIPRFLGGIRAMSFVYVEDLAAAVMTCLTHPAAVGKAFFVSGRETIAPHGFARLIAEQMGVRAFTLPLPTVALWPVCALQEMVARATGVPTIVNRQKYAEMTAPGWVCDPTRLREVLGITCNTTLADGVARTLEWYRRERWL